MPDRLDPIRDLARSINASDEEWEAKKARADAEIDEGRVLVEAAKRELAGGTVTRIHQEPTAEVTLTQRELDAVLNRLETAESDGLFVGHGELSALNKFRQAVAIESGPGGRFYGDGAA